ncbi:hypothetical protein ACN68H_09710 [Aerococcus viridans]
MTDAINNSLYIDWQMTSEKEAIIAELNEKSNAIKNDLPVLLSKYDLRQRWAMNNRQSLYNYTRRKDFPKPIYYFSNGKTPVYLETDIQIFEIKYPWIVSEESRKKYADWVFKNVILDEENPNNLVNW